MEENSDFYQMKVSTMEQEKKLQDKSYRKLFLVVLIVSTVSIVLLNVVNYFIPIY